MSDPVPTLEADVMSEPKRIQRKRAKGWRMPEGAVYVGRPTKWGNPFTLTRYGRALAMAGFRRITARPSGQRSGWVEARFVGYPGDDEIQSELRGKDLACWCSLSVDCHADVLLEIANV